MRDLIETLLDGDEVVSRAENEADIALTIEWLEKQHSTMPNRIDLRNKDSKYYDENGKLLLHLSDTDLTFEKTIPSFINIATCRSLTLVNLNIETVLDNGLPIPSRDLFIRDCKNLKTLDGCPHKLEKFSVSNCPKITSLDGAPKEVEKLFKVVNCGKKFEYKDVKHVCKVKQENMIY